MKWSSLVATLKRCCKRKRRVLDEASSNKKLNALYEANTLDRLDGEEEKKERRSTKEANVEIPFLSVCATLIQTCVNAEDAPGLVRELLEMHRIEQNTKARRRLERWITKLIFAYFAVVLLLIVVFYSLAGLCFSRAKISDAVMITILSTTTVNVIGLAVILVRGLFPSEERERFTKFRKRKRQL